MLYFVSILISLITIAIVVLPLIFFKKQTLQSASTENSLEKLNSMREAILKRYVEEEKAFSSSKTDKMIWEQRKNYLTNRYLDVVKRLDYLGYLKKSS